MTAQPNKRDIQAQVAAGNWSDLREQLARWPAPEVADLLLELDKPERVLLFRALPRNVAAQVFSFLEPDREVALLSELGDRETRRVLADMRPDDRTELLEELPDHIARKLLALLSPEDLREARQLLGYPEDSVGRLMTPEFVAVRPEWSAKQAIRHIRADAAESETIHTIFVTNETGVLLGSVEIGRLILAVSDTSVESLMRERPVALRAATDQEEAARVVRRYDLHVAPVIGPDGVMLGIVTVDDILDVVEEETTEDIYRGASVSHGAPVGLKTGLREATFSMIWRARIGWLVLLVFANMFSGAGIAFYEETIEAAIALVFFLPLLIDSGGNAGTQSATLVVRALATGDLRLRDLPGQLGRELGVALALGLAMAVAVFGLALWRGGWDIAWVVAMTMVCTVTFGSIIGLLLPFILERLKLDPATASAPLITSIADIAGVLIYFGIATWYLGLGG